MKNLEIKKGIYWVGAVDWTVKNFHGHTYATQRGTSYNAYLIVDEKIALIDTVYGAFAQEMVERIKNIIPVERIDYIIANHVEIDHSGALPTISALCPQAKVLGTAKCKDGLYKHYYGNWDFQVVKTADTLNLGRRSLTFIEAPMIHWPDSMFTYCPEEELLFPNDAFGQHYATCQRFDDEVNPAELMEEAEKYYANILWPLSPLILKKIEDLQKSNISIKMIAPSHGVIWRKDPYKIMNAYVSWAKNETISKAVIVYETMWSATEKMARQISQGIIDAGIEVKLYDVNQADRTEVIKEMLSAEVFIFGSSTHDNGLLPNLAGFLEFLKGLKPQKRFFCAFGSYGWSGGAVERIEKLCQEAGLKMLQPGLSIRYVPDKEELNRCYAYGQTVAAAIKR